VVAEFLEDQLHDGVPTAAVVLQAAAEGVRHRPVEQPGGVGREKAPGQGVLAEIDQEAKLLQDKLFQALGAQAGGADTDFGQGDQGLRGHKAQGVETGGGRKPAIATEVPGQGLGHNAAAGIPQTDEQDLGRHGGFGFLKANSWGRGLRAYKGETPVPPALTPSPKPLYRPGT